MDQIEKSTGQVKAGMEAERREKERTGKRSGGESINAFGIFETHPRGKKLKKGA